MEHILNYWDRFAIFLYFGDLGFEKKTIVTTSKKKEKEKNLSTEIKLVFT